MIHSELIVSMADISNIKVWMSSSSIWTIGIYLSPVSSELKHSLLWYYGQYHFLLLPLFLYIASPRRISSKPYPSTRISNIFLSVSVLIPSIAISSMVCQTKFLGNHIQRPFIHFILQCISYLQKTSPWCWHKIHVGAIKRWSWVLKMKLIEHKNKVK